MQYKVLPFHPTITDKGGAEQAAKELQIIIDKEVSDGWKFQMLETITTTMKPTGCAALFGKSELKTVQLAVFEK